MLVSRALFELGFMCTCTSAVLLAVLVSQNYRHAVCTSKQLFGTIKGITKKCQNLMQESALQILAALAAKIPGSG